MRSRAFTLMELLVTVAIVMVIMGISVGVLSRLGHKNALDANHQAVRSLLRRAHNASREERFGAIVEIDRGGSELRAHQKTSITQFRFESKTDLSAEEGTRTSGESADDATPLPWETTGAKGVTLTVDGGEQVKGRYGLGALFERTGPEGAAWAYVEERPALNPREGVYVECWVYLGHLEDRLRDRASRLEPSSEQEENWARGGEPPRSTPMRVAGFSQSDPPIFYAVRKGRAFSLGVTAAYEVEVAITGPEDPEFTYLTRTRPGTLRADRWYRVAFSFDGRQVQIFVDGISRMHLRAHRDDTALFDSLDGQGADEVQIGETKLKGQDVLDDLELRAAGELGQRLLDGADRGGEGNGDGLVTRAEFLARVPSQLIYDTSPLICSDPHPERAFFGVIDELKYAGVLRSQRLQIPAEVVLIAPEDTVSFDMLGQLDPARHAEAFVIFLTDDARVYEVLDPSPEQANPTKTLTRGQQTAQQRQGRNLQLGRAPYERFLKALEKQDVDPNRVRRIVVGRTGLVTE